MKSPAKQSLLRIAAMLALHSHAFVAIARAQSLPPKPDEFNNWMYEGDPRLLPALRARLAAAEVILRENASYARLAAEVADDAARYQLEEALPLMSLVYESCDEQPEVLDSLATSATEYRSEAAERFQRTLLADRRVTKNSQRVSLLSALAERGDDKAADALADWFEVEVKRAGTRSDASADESLWLTRSKRLADRISALPTPNPAKSRVLQNRVVTHLNIAQLDKAELFALISENDGSSHMWVATAIKTLGRIGTMEDAKLLARMKLGKDDCLIFQDQVVRAQLDSISAIRRKHWKEAATQPAINRRLQ